MKIKHSNIDNFIYILSCIVSGGVIWLFRIIISEAIRKALQESEK